MRILFTVTNQLNYDQRMIRICNSLTKAGYEVELIGVRFSRKDKLRSQIFKLKTIRIFYKRGFAFYAEYNLKLFFHLLFQRADAICSIDLDTILPVYFVCKIRRMKRFHDAHEYFSEMKEVVTRRKIYRFWHWVERIYLPKFPQGYTVSASIARAFKIKYNLHYEVIRNLPLAFPLNGNAITENKKLVIYQGSVNHARGLEYLIPSMKQVDSELHIYGDGNFMKEARELAESHQLTRKIFFMGNKEPDELRKLTPAATVGINLVEPEGLNQIYSLANKFFDYIQAGVPQLTMNFPEYKKINDQFDIGLLIDELTTENVARAINRLLLDEELHGKLRKNCLIAGRELTWQREEKKLIAFYEKNLSS